MQVIDFSLFCPTTTLFELSELSTYGFGRTMLCSAIHESGRIIVTLKDTGLMYVVGLGELRITWGGSLIGGIGVAGFPQVGLASATSSKLEDSIRIIINRIVVAITALLIATNPTPLYSIAVLLLSSTHGTPN